jgi:hypothetical protein
LLFRQATRHATLLHPFLYVIDFKRALGFGEAQLFAINATTGGRSLVGKNQHPEVSAAARIKDCLLSLTPA